MVFVRSCRSLILQYVAPDPMLPIHLRSAHRLVRYLQLYELLIQVISKLLIAHVVDHLEILY